MSAADQVARRERREADVIVALMTGQGFPMSTAEVHQLVHPSYSRFAVQVALQNLAHDGRIERIRLDGFTRLYWRA